MQYTKTAQIGGTIVGAIFCVLGLIGLVLPFLQGVVCIAIGIAILSTFSPGFGRCVGRIKAAYPYVGLHIDRAEERIESLYHRGSRQTIRSKITLQDGRKISVIYDIPRQPIRGIAVIVHGLGGYKEQSLFRILKETFLQSDIVSVRFDTTNGVGESTGMYPDATLTGTIEDVVSVVELCMKEPWYGEVPLVLCGHSLGGIAVFEYAEQHPSRVAGVIGVGSVIAGSLTLLALEAETKGMWDEWQRIGYRIDKVAARSPYNRLKVAHMHDRLLYDLREKASRVTMPVALFVGENDLRTPLHDQQELFVKLPGPKSLTVLNGVGHMPRAHTDLVIVRDTLTQWLQSADSPIIHLHKLS